MTAIEARPIGVNNRGAGVYHDPVLQTGAILIDDDAYTAGLTYTYDTRGFDEGYIEIINEGGTNGLTYTIEKCRKSYTTISTLVDADFNEVIQADANVAALANANHTLTDLTPEVTSIRIRVKRQTSLLNTTFGGLMFVK